MFLQPIPCWTAVYPSCLLDLLTTTWYSFHPCFTSRSTGKEPDIEFYIEGFAFTKIAILNSAQKSRNITLSRVSYCLMVSSCTPPIRAGNLYSSCVRMYDGNRWLTLPRNVDMSVERGSRKGGREFIYPRLTGVVHASTLTITIFKRWTRLPSLPSLLAVALGFACTTGKKDERVFFRGRKRELAKFRIRSKPKSRGKTRGERKEQANWSNY